MSMTYFTLSETNNKYLNEVGGRVLNHVLNIDTNNKLGAEIEDKSGWKVSTSVDYGDIHVIMNHEEAGHTLELINSLIRWSNAHLIRICSVSETSIIFDIELVSNFLSFFSLPKSSNIVVNHQRNFNTSENNNLKELIAFADKNNLKIERLESSSKIYSVLCIINDTYHEMSDLIFFVIKKSLEQLISKDVIVSFSDLEFDNDRKIIRFKFI
ncbi:hypothetical protein [Proteus mirabilis]|uniref:hypothetical protein n=1 Tax=Proteus mirabilis TaxID=584 RepID=UPI0034D76AD2